MEKTIEFDDGSSLKLNISNEEMSITIQAKHLEEQKFTSVNVKLTKEETQELIKEIVNGYKCPQDKN